VEVVIGVLVGWATVASLFAAARLLRPAPVISSERAHAIQSALHAATVMLPNLRRGLSVQSASRAMPRLLMLTQAAAVALAGPSLCLRGTGPVRIITSVGTRSRSSSTLGARIASASSRRSRVTGLGARSARRSWRRS
jgi:hypothetical protein